MNFPVKANPRAQLTLSIPVKFLQSKVLAPSVLLYTTLGSTKLALRACVCVCVYECVRVVGNGDNEWVWGRRRSTIKISQGNHIYSH